jgi:hypothetical protein
MWQQGVDEMPPLLRRCLDSWREQNPSREVVLLSKDSLADWVDPELLTERFQRIPLAAFSELLRLDVLNRFGGVWADVTCYCVRPVDEWLPPLLPSGFFAFASPHRSRIMSTWFLAATQGNELVARLDHDLRRYHGRPRLVHEQKVSRLTWKLGKVFNANVDRTRWWFRFPLSQLGLTPYYSLHYLFAKVVHDDPDLARIWAATPKVSADPPHSLRHNGFGLAPSEALQLEIETRAVPVYKLDWRYDPDTMDETAALRLLLAQ